MAAAAASAVTFDSSAATKLVRSMVGIAAGSMLGVFFAAGLWFPEERLPHTVACGSNRHSWPVQVNGIEISQNDDRDYQFEALANGLKLIVVSDPKAELVRVPKPHASSLDWCYPALLFFFCLCYCFACLW